MVCFIKGKSTTKSYRVNVRGRGDSYSTQRPQAFILYMDTNGIQGQWDYKTGVHRTGAAPPC